MLLHPSRNAEHTDLLRGVALFADATPRQLAAIAEVARAVEFPAGAVICTEGASGIGLHVIKEGTVRVTSSHSPPTTLGPGAYFGEIALLDGGPRMATVTAETAVVTVSIVAWEFKGIMDNQPQVTRHLLEEMCTRLRQQAASINQ